MQIYIRREHPSCKGSHRTFQGRCLSLQNHAEYRGGFHDGRSKAHEEWSYGEEMAHGGGQIGAGDTRFGLVLWSRVGGRARWRLALQLERRSAETEASKRKSKAEETFTIFLLIITSFQTGCFLNFVVNGLHL